MVQSVRFDGPVPRRVDRYEVNNSILWSHEGARDEESLAPEEFVQQVLSAPTGGALGLEWSH